MAKYMDLLLARNGVGDGLVFLAPTHKAEAGDVVIFEGEMFDVEKTDWINIESNTYQILQEAGVLLVPEKILSLRWEQEDSEAENEQNA